MRKLVFCLSLCCLLALCASGLALSQDYDLFYGGDLTPIGETHSPRSLLTLANFPEEPIPGKDDSPGVEPAATEPPVEEVVLFPDPRDVRPIGQSLLPTMVFGEERVIRSAGLAPGFTTLWGGKIDLTLTNTDDKRTALLGTQALTGEFVPRTVNGADPSWGSITPASLTTNIQSLVTASEMPPAGHTVLLANHATLEAIAEAGAVPSALLETGGLPANLLLDEGSILRLIGPVALSDGPLSSLSLAANAKLEVNYTPTAALPNALALPMVLTLYDEAALSLTLQDPAVRNPALPQEAPYTTAMLALSSLGQNQISLSPGSNFDLVNKSKDGRVFSVGMGLRENIQENIPGSVQQGVLQIIANRVALTTGNNQKTTWDNGTTPFVLSLTYDGEGKVLAAETTGFTGKKPSTSGLSLTGLTALSASRDPEVEELPDEEEEEKEPFNGWAIGVDHVYMDGGLSLLIPQWPSHTVSWASKTGDNVTIRPVGYAGFTPTEAEHVVRNVRKHGTYDYVYTRNTTTRTATIRVDGAGLDAAALAALRAAAHGTIRLYQDGGYKELAYTMPAGADSTTVSGTVFTHTPAGSALSSSFSMPTPPQGLKVSASGDVFTLSYATPPTPDVQVTVQYRYSPDGVLPFDKPIPSQPDSQQSIAPGGDLTKFQKTLDGYTFVGIDGTAQAGATVTVKYTRNRANITGTLTITDPADAAALPGPITSNPGTTFGFALGTAADLPDSVSINGLVVTATWSNQYTHEEDGTLRLMTCTPAWTGATSIQMSGYAGSVNVEKYTITVNHAVDGAGSAFFSDISNRYYQGSADIGPGSWAGLAQSSGPAAYTINPVVASVTENYTYTRTARIAAAVKIWFEDAAVMPSDYSATLQIRITGKEGEPVRPEDPTDTLTVQLVQPLNSSEPATATATTPLTFYKYPLPTSADPVTAYADINVVLKDDSVLPNITPGTARASAPDYETITIYFPANSYVAP